MSEKLEFKDVGLIYQTAERETEALKNLTLKVSDGEFVALVGPSGCGKTTVLSLAAGLIEPTYGRVELEGSKVRAGEGVGYMLQRDELFEWRTIIDNVLLGSEIKRTIAADRPYAELLLDKYGLSQFKKARPNQLSGGMRQRAALIRTLAQNPKLLLLDEPFSAIDFQTRMTVCDDVSVIIKSENKTAVLVTHDISEALSLADRIIILSSRPGTVVSEVEVKLDGSPMQRRESHEFSKMFDKVWRLVVAAKGGNDESNG